MVNYICLAAVTDDHPEDDLLDFEDYNFDIHSHETGWITRDPEYNGHLSFYFEINRPTPSVTERVLVARVTGVFNRQVLGRRIVLGKIPEFSIKGDDRELGDEGHSNSTLAAIA